MRDQEIASTVKDLEMRHLELESQKRLYEKVKISYFHYKAIFNIRKVEFVQTLFRLYLFIVI